MINHNRKEFLKSKAFRGQITCLRLLYSQKLAWSGFEDFPGGSAVKNPPAMQEPQEATVSIPRLGRSPEGRNGNPLQCYCLENPMDPALSNAEPELLTSTLFSLISLFLHSFIYSIVHSCMHQTFSESLWWARNCVRHRQREWQKNSLHELHKLTVGRTGEQTMTIHSAMEAMGEENQSCYEKRTNFPCIVQAQVLWNSRGVTNTTGTGGLSLDVQTRKGCLYLQGGIWIRLLTPRILGSGVASTGQESTLPCKWTSSDPSYQAQGHLSTQYHQRNRKKSSLLRESWVRVWYT